MKRLVALTVVVLSLSQIVSAEVLKNFKANGSLEVNAYNINNADFDKDLFDKISGVDTRLMLDINFDLNEDASSVVSLVKNNRQWGDDPENVNSIQSNIIIQQAYINLKGVMGMDHKVGRQYYGKPGDLVIYYGPQMWPYGFHIGAVSAIDSWVGSYKYTDWTFTGLLGKEANSNMGMGKNLSGLDINGKVDRFNLNAYYYYKVDNSVTPLADKLALFGFRANWDCQFVKGLNLGFEYDKNAGKDSNSNKYKGYAFKANAGYSLNLAGNLGFNGEYTYISGQDTSTDIKLFRPINIDYRPGIISNGFGVYNTYVTSIGTGIKVINLGVNWTPEKLNKLTIAFDYINTKVAEEYPDMKDTIGNEYDFTLTWKHSDNVSVKGYLAMLKPEKDNVINSGYGLKDDMETAIGTAFIVKF